MIARSASSREARSGRPPTWRFDRTSSLRGDAQHRADGLAVDEQDALVAPADVGEVALGHGPARPEGGRLLEDRDAGSGRRGAGRKMPSPPFPWSGLTIISPPSFSMKSSSCGILPDDRGLRHQLRKVQGVELLVGGQDALGAVQHEAAAAQREDLRRRHVVGVHRGVRALEHDVDVVVEHEACGGARARRAGPARGAASPAGRPPPGPPVARRPGPPGRRRGPGGPAAGPPASARRSCRPGCRCDSERIHDECHGAGGAGHSETPLPSRSGSAGGSLSATVG